MTPECQRHSWPQSSFLLMIPILLTTRRSLYRARIPGSTLAVFLGHIWCWASNRIHHVSHSQPDVKGHDYPFTRKPRNAALFISEFSGHADLHLSIIPAILSCMYLRQASRTFKVNLLLIVVNELPPLDPSACFFSECGGSLRPFTMIEGVSSYSAL